MSPEPVSAFPSKVEDRPLLVIGRVERDGESIYYEWAVADDTDDRPVVVLTHGAGGSHAVWYHQLIALSSRYRVLTWDSRGFGNSTCNSGVLTVDQAVADLAAVLDAVGVDGPVHLVGQSMGGWWVSAYAIADPERGLSLTLSDTPGGVWTDELREFFATFRSSTHPGPARVASHFALGRTTLRTRPDLAFLYQQLGSFHQPPMAEVAKIVSVSVEPAALTALGFPLNVIAGAEDSIFPAPMLESIATMLGAAYREIAQAGHSPYFESPAAYNEALFALLGRA